MSQRPAIEVVGHGGAGDFYPGNSRQAVEKALDIGVDRVEVDVQRAADGRLVLVHDEEIRIGGGEHRPVHTLTTDDLRAALPGLLTLDEGIALIGGRAPVMIDVKGPGYERELVDGIRRHGLAARSSVSCTDPRVLRHLRRAFPEMRLGLSTGHWASGAPTRIGRWIVRALMRLVMPIPLVVAARVIGATEVMLFHRVCTQAMVRLLHARGLRINVWTVDRPASIRRAIALGVDGIISNRPDLVWEELERADGHRRDIAD